MKVLLVTFGLPYPPNFGASIRDFHLLRELSLHAEVHLFSLLLVEPPAGALRRLRDYCHTVSSFLIPRRSLIRHLRDFREARRLKLPLAAHPFYLPEAAEQIRRMIDGYHPDIVQIEHSLLACYRAAVPDGGRLRSVLSFHNVGWLQYARMSKLECAFTERISYAVKARLMRGWETRIASRFDHTVVVSAAEARLLAKADPALSISVVENGVDCERFQTLAPAETENRLLFVGVLNYPPNRDAVLYFCAHILPLVRRAIPDLKLTVIGHNPPREIQQLASPSVRVMHCVEDLLPYYQEANATIVPLRAGAGTRLKILESMALGRAIVSTSIGCEGLDVIHDQHLLVADPPESFAEATIRLLRQPELRASLAANARRLVVERYEWTTIGRRLLGVYQELLEDRSAASCAR